MSFRNSLIIGSLLGFLSVALGAFGSHALRALLEANQRVDTFELAARYQFYHALAILTCALLMRHFPEASKLRLAALFFLIGVLLFSGSLYVLALANARAVAMITPLGGVSFLLGWIYLLWAALKMPRA